MPSNASMSSVTGVSIKARSMAPLPFLCLDPLGLVARVARRRGETGHQFAEERALFEVLTEARMRGRNPVERQHLLHRVGIAEQHYDFLQVRAAHGLTPGKTSGAQTARDSCHVNSKAHAK
jgi:hypothetical protein